MEVNILIRKVAIGVVAVCGFIGCFSAGAQEVPEREKVVDMLVRVNETWQKAHPEHGRAFWDNAAYHTGNIEAWKLTGRPDFKQYSIDWAEHNGWQGAKGTDPARWKYSYGETDDFALFGDWQTCFQVYADLYGDKPEEKRIARAREVMEYQMDTPQTDYWWWADGLYMAMPVMTRLYKITGNDRYLDKMHQYWSYADSLMYDREEHLYYRDGKYLYPKHKTLSGKKDFWARGDGWVLASLARVLTDMPADRPEKKIYEQRFRELASAVKACQQPEGYWTRSLLDPDQAPGPETSGTAFFTYGLLWGIRNGLLDRGEYLPAALKGWKYLTETALQPDGTVGYVQPIGERAEPGQTVDAASVTNFGTGAFLLAACELARLAAD